MSDIDVAFGRALLKQAHTAVRAAFPAIKVRDDAWVWHFHRDDWEFHGPDEFYWYGSAGNAYEARYKGWMSWLKHKRVNDDE